MTNRLTVFISHSSRDERFAAALARLIQKSLGLRARDIRCTSVKEYRLPAGADIDAIIRDEVAAARAFVGLITPSSLESYYVLFELGARWGAHLPLAPLIACGATASDLKGPLTRLNALSADDPAQLHQLLNDLGTITDVELEPVHAYYDEIQATLHLAAHRSDTELVNPTPVRNTEKESSSADLSQSTLITIRRICESAAEENDDIYVDPRIPPRVLRNARDRFLKEEDNVIAFVDNSYGGKDGLAVLASGLCWRNTYRQPSHRLSWADLRKHPARAHKSIDAVCLGRDFLIQLSGSNAESKVIARLIRDIVGAIS